MVRLVPLVALAATAACVATPPRSGLAAPAPRFDVAGFFVGASHGDGTLRIALHAPRRVRVASIGRLDPDGSLVLDQRIAAGDGPTRSRRWRLHAVAPGRLAGTLSDATGPVTGTVAGNALHLRFAMKRGLIADQWIYLQPGGGVALNRMTVRTWGVPVATLVETITRALAVQPFGEEEAPAAARMVL